EREALSVLSEAKPPAEAAILGTQVELADVLRLRSRLDEAASVAGEVLARYAAATPADEAGVARTTLLIRQIRHAQGGLPDGERGLAHALALSRRLYGDANESTLAAKEALAFTLVTGGESARAEPLLREVVDDTRRIYGAQHPDLGVALSDLGNALSDSPEKL